MTDPASQTPSAAREYSMFVPGDDAPIATADMAILTEPEGRRAEAIRALRTHIVAQHINVGRRALAICGATKGVGSTFVAANLAVALSQIGLRTLLIDGDLRTMGMNAFFARPPGTPGLHQLLALPDMSFDTVIAEEVLPNLDVLNAGAAGPDAQELLSGERFSALIDSCLRAYDITIVDTPAANSCADVQRIASVIGYGLIVVRRNETLIDDIKTLRSQLEQVGVRAIGTVLSEG